MTTRPTVRWMLLLPLVALVTVSSCTVADVAAPRCEPTQRLGTVAQAVPGAAYLPCIKTLPAGWNVESFDVRRGRVAMTLASDREERPVRVELTPSCGLHGATAVAPRDIGVRTYVRIETIERRYSGAMLDLFPGGCVTYRFDFARGPHITLTDEMRTAVGLYSRRDLRRELRQRYGIKLDG